MESQPARPSYPTVRPKGPQDPKDTRPGPSGLSRNPLFLTLRLTLTLNLRSQVFTPPLSWDERYFGPRPQAEPTKSCMTTARSKAESELIQSLPRPENLSATEPGPTGQL